MTETSYGSTTITEVKLIDIKKLDEATTITLEPGKSGLTEAQVESMIAAYTDVYVDGLETLIKGIEVVNLLRATDEKVETAKENLRLMIEEVQCRDGLRRSPPLGLRAGRLGSRFPSPWRNGQSLLQGKGAGRLHSP